VSLSGQAISKSILALIFPLNRQLLAYVGRVGRLFQQLHMAFAASDNWLRRATMMLVHLEPCQTGCSFCMVGMELGVGNRGTGKGSTGSVRGSTGEWEAEGTGKGSLGNMETFQKKRPSVPGSLILPRRH
jgi:hypothetical protein